VDARPIIVCGMPRSGTSYVASLLHAAGVHLGERVLGPSASNPRGHFEDLDFTDLHERMLRAQSAQLRDEAMINQLAIEAEFDGEALALVRRKARRAVWGWKDTRNGLFLDFWTRLLPEARFVLVYRHPRDVVDSLVRRGDRGAAGNEAIHAIAWTDYCERLLRLRQDRAQHAILAEVRGIAAGEAAFLALLRERFGCDLRSPQREVFEPELLRVADPALDDLSVFGEAEELYALLEAAADTPGVR
jgi:hypothetical protein